MQVSWKTDGSKLSYKNIQKMKMQKRYYYEQKRYLNLVKVYNFYNKLERGRHTLTRWNIESIVKLYSASSNLAILWTLSTCRYSSSLRSRTQQREKEIPKILSLSIDATLMALYIAPDLATRSPLAINRYQALTRKSVFDISGRCSMR